MSYRESRAKNRQDVIQLITTEVKEINGYQTEQETGRTPPLFALRREATRTEYYAALQANRKISAVFELCPLDYDDQTLLEYNGHLYKVERAFTVDRDTLSLSCSRRADR